MKITRISETKRGRFALFSDEEFLFSVDAETLCQYGVTEGVQLDEAAFSGLKSMSDTRRAKDQALRYLSLRAYAQQELYDKLCLKYDAPTAAAAMASLAGLGLLDDADYALEKARGMAQRGKSRLEISRALSAAGVDSQVADAALEQAGIDEPALALALIEKKYTEKLRRGERQKVMAALARRGFGHSVIRCAVETAEQRLQAQELEFE